MPTLDGGLADKVRDVISTAVKRVREIFAEEQFSSTLFHDNQRIPKSLMFRMAELARMKTTPPTLDSQAAFLERHGPLLVGEERRLNNWETETISMQE
jgi:hypothetical protein